MVENSPMLGNVTSYQWNGCSVVDYAITSLSLFHKTLTFEIGKYQPWISDHCPLHHCLQIKNYSHVCPPNNSDLHNLPGTWYWDNYSKEIFMLCLQTREISTEIENIVNMNAPTDMAQKISDMLMFVANKSLKKKKRPSRS